MWLFATESYVIHAHRDTDNAKGRVVFTRVFPSRHSVTAVTGVAIKFMFAISTSSLCRPWRRNHINEKIMKTFF